MMVIYGKHKAKKKKVLLKIKAEINELEKQKV